ncbi:MULTISPECIES: helix-turn-helix domain-containing protein [Aneurinibacillus]|uniref:Helix-turn-helix domain-containing protein n=1 Tax=Aneurinibacillus thermoaerophilus TaxID=143495 RepID=A0ABX8YDC6_ANETH|nr:MULTISPECIES: helix-turn-helix transcriptional regulator [Aneurinibacillus]AMA74329.1 XRE family transcriptional regulator [Aneurinibacillus sp. XH2]MED0677690.1 helix-turn-helix transcriptional regulator [Aneurinibacillus thermoaerophilus]MED0681437.1 helix-turn-helix transcriptional regulator [Aneurinibacillus thermoaerophilus]MED0737833.1 helix-turn-helix transcriptional regulator [Aneurinibacillus thermoaerophilus]MED0766370.1 helix-turn-helix transcriptional regulator [Aneurinibacillus
MDVSKRLTEIRESLGLSKNQLAKMSGVSQSFISYIEAGQRQPTLDIIERLCSALGITVIQFLSDDSDQLPPDLLQLIETAKKLTPEERKKVTDMLQTMLERMNQNE